MQSLSQQASGTWRSGRLPASPAKSHAAQLVRSFDPLTALTMIAATIAFAVLAQAMFSLGLRRYSSGSVWAR